jgi:membrane-associated protease RseP (regulator of RpoE activity)
MRKIKTNIILFVLTLASTTVAGAFLAGINPLKEPYLAYYGLMFSVPLMSILVVHELGHYIAARRHRVMVTLPYFIPAPSIIGTFGAFIKIKSPLPDRNALIDIGAAGPLAGIAVAIPVLILGLIQSETRAVAELSGLSLGTSILFDFLTRLIHGSVAEGYDIVLHPVAFAGWIGMLVTALNLLPVGQLDGGHIAYALFGERYSGVSRVFPILLIPMGVLWEGWVIWAILLILLGTGHPPPMDVETGLTRGRKIAGYVSLLIFILCFTPVPVKF